jgi:hypothetical protein
MNPDRIYRQYRDDALAGQITASEYTTSVAMPFGDKFSYRSREVYSEIICKAAERANGKGCTSRAFAKPMRVDGSGGTARVLTEAIIVNILESHIFLADLTFENTNVLLETGIAFGMKPNPQIILITQGNLSELSFNIRNNGVLQYNSGGSVDIIADALIEAANAFEADQEKRISSITQRLSPDAIICLRRYAEIQQLHAANSLHAGIADKIFLEGRAYERFEASTRDLLHAGLLLTDWKVKAINGNDAFGMHATKLGWSVISHLWNELTIPGR